MSEPLQEIVLGKIGMTTVYDVPADILIGGLKEYLKSNVVEMVPPIWVKYVKTGSHVERVPQDPDWWYVRSSSLLRKLYIMGHIGVSHLRKEYGGRKRNGVKPAHFRRAGGNIIRKILQQLESAGLAEKDVNKGRIISSKGRSLLDVMSTHIKNELDRVSPELRAY